MLIVVGIVIGLVVGAAAAFFALHALAGSRLAAARRTRQLLIAEAKREAEALRREAQIEAREEAVQLRSQVEGEVQAAPDRARRRRRSARRRRRPSSSGARASSSAASRASPTARCTRSSSRRS